MVDGMPLGIELAGNWAGMLSPHEIAVEIRNNLDFLTNQFQDMPDRQKSIYSVFESSWNRLTTLEQNVFQRLSVFRGGFTRQAAERVAGASLQTLMGLVNKSLVQPDYTGRYHLHELLRQYGREKLTAADQSTQTRNNHLAFFLNLAQEAEPMLEGADQITWANRLELEHDNLRAAVDWSLSAEGMAKEASRLTASLGTFWQWRGYFIEGRENISAELANADPAERTESRAKALYQAGLLAYVQSDFPESGRLLNQCLSIYRELGIDHQLSLAHTLIMIGDVETGVGNYKTVLSVIEEGLGIMRALGERGGTSRAFWKLGWVTMSQGDFNEASEYFTEALPYYKQIENKEGIAMVLAGLGEVKLRLEAHEDAARLLDESLALRRETKDTWGIAASLGSLGWAALRRGEWKQADALLRDSLSRRRELRDMGGSAWCLEKMAEIALKTAQQVTSVNRDKSFRRAARLFGTAASLRAPVKSVIDLADQPNYERLLTTLRTQLGEEGFTAAWAEGQAMTLEQAIAHSRPLDSNTRSVNE